MAPGAVSRHILRVAVSQATVPALAGLVLGLVLASLLPARRALRIQPMDALRHE